ncbi:S41 family peptidase [Alteromonas facilis]|uniref:S41 family peptidase n=1 Tax=Alteromonas facilis TaxID=2048004 RepID=UPI000C281BB3|nr:S41 family peptidase [Alteromonas facilis]
MKPYIFALAVMLNTQTSVANENEFKDVILSAADIIETQLYSETIGQEVAQQIKQPDFIAYYATSEDKQAFAQKLSKALRQVSGDNHIGIVFAPKDVERYRIREKAKVNDAARTQNKENYQHRLAESVAENFGIRQLRVLDGDIGYIEMSYFDGFVDESAPVFESAMNFLSSSHIIILDLRRNGGGNSRILPLFLGYFLGPEPVHFATRYERWKGSQETLMTDNQVKGARFFDKPLYILTSGTTFSLAEHVTYHLKAFDRATIVGERTYGGGKAFDPVVLNDDFYLRIPRIEMANAVTHDMYEEGKGILPDIAVSADSAFHVAYLAALQQLMLENDKNPSQTDYLQWLQRVVAAEIDPPKQQPVLPDIDENQHFEEFRFSPRNGELWMSFRELPWVKLQTLHDGYFYDDRSIQRQFRFIKTNGKWAVQVFRAKRPPNVIIES